MEGGAGPAVEALYDYLAARDAPVAPADLVIGFGHFDPRVSRRCGDLWEAGLADRILFTGGVGAGTADLGKPEALFFWDELRLSHPHIPAQAVLIELDSRHTGENIEMSQGLPRAVSPEACIEQGIEHVILVATPARQRRVWLACRQHWPHVRLTNAPPESALEADVALFASKGRNLRELLAGEARRILAYPALGYIAADEVPGNVLAAYSELTSLSSC